MRVLVLDNYDSFTWNLVHALEAVGGRCTVHRSDRISVANVAEMAPDRILLSPGPFGPDQAGICPDVVREFAGRIPILGVCLGMQVIATVAGARVVPSGRPVHGKASRISHDGKGMLAGLPNPFDGGRYHSLIVDPESVPAGLEVTSYAAEAGREGIASPAANPGTIMGCRFRDTDAPVEGVLFHPESFLTGPGARIFENLLSASHVV